MTLDTGIEVAREKLHHLPMPDADISHLNALAVKDKKSIRGDPAFLYHGLVIPDDASYFDADDSHSSPLPTVITEGYSFYPTDDHDSPNRGGEYEEIEETRMSESPTENQQTEVIGGVPITTEEIGGARREKFNDDSRKDYEGTILKKLRQLIQKCNL